MRLPHLFIDLNAYFASCEQHRHPRLRGRAVVIRPAPTDSTCCISASYEAKPYGIKTGTPIYEARLMCPNVCVVDADPQYYIQIHHQIIAAVDTCLPVDQTHSIDEVSCRLLGKEQHPVEAERLGRMIKHAIRSQVGDALKCSVGIAPNLLWAKFATDMQKPDGLTILQLHDLHDRVRDYPVTDLPGIGTNMQVRLDAVGINNMQQLLSADEATLVRAWGGVMGQWWHRWLRGEDIQRPPTRTRQVGHSHVLPMQWRTPDAAHAIMIRLLTKAAARLRYMNYWASSILFHAKIQNGPSWLVKKRIGYCQDTFTMIHALNDAWKTFPRATPTKVDLVLYDLTNDTDVTRPLFNGEIRYLNASGAVDKINARYGKNTVYFAGMHHVRQSAPTRIAFHHVPDLNFSDA